MTLVMIYFILICHTKTQHRPCLYSNSFLVTQSVAVKLKAPTTSLNTSFLFLLVSPVPKNVTWKNSIIKIWQVISLLHQAVLGLTFGWNPRESWKCFPRNGSVLVLPWTPKMTTSNSMSNTNSIFYLSSLRSKLSRWQIPILQDKAIQVYQDWYDAVAKQWTQIYIYIYSLKEQRVSSG